jgi:hypothetical protein
MPTKDEKQNKNCKIEKCLRPLSAKGYCKQHYNTREATTNDRKCIIEPCNNVHLAKGYCSYHYQLDKRLTIPKEERIIKICLIVNCDVKVKAKGLCSKHYIYMKRHGDPLINYHRKHRNKQKINMRNEFRYRLNCDEKSEIEVYFKESVGINECENIYSIE